MKAVVTGSIAYDYLMSFPGRFTDHLIADQLDKISVSFLVDSLRRQRGGTACNIAYTLALLGDRPMIMATAGQDFADYRAWLESHGVDTSAIVEIANEYCASFFVSTDEAQNQIASFYTGAMAHAARLTFAEHAADAQLTIISPNDPGAMRLYAEECKELGIAYIYDPSQQTIRLSVDDLRAGVDGCALLTVNEYEFSMIAEKSGMTMDDVLAQAGGVVVTRGRAGSRIYARGECYDIPTVLPRQVVDPTGAGDAYRAGLIRGMQLALPWELCGRMGALAATYVLEHLGTMGHQFSPAEFVTRFRQNFEDYGALDALLR
jgi:adenosine kinase